MVGYIALFIVGLLFLAGLAYIFRHLFRVMKKGELEEDPLLDSLEASEAAETLKSGKVMGVVLYGVTFFALLWYLFSYEPAPAYEVTSAELYQAFISDREAASAKYRNEMVLVTGKYVGDEVVFGSPAILLQTPADIDRVQCNFEGSRADQTVGLSLGQELKLKGRVLGKTGKTNNVVLEKCSVQ